MRKSIVFSTSMIIIATFVVMFVGYNIGYNEAKITYETELEKYIYQYEELNLKGVASNSDFYYGEADIINQEKVENDLVAVTWRINYSLNQCFVTYSPDYLDDNKTYLLTIYNNKTHDISDDEIAVIWSEIE